MLEQLQNIITAKSKYYVLGVIASNQKNDYYLMRIKSVQGELIIEERLGITSFDHLNKDIPVILHIEGEDIISKQVKAETGYRNSLVFGANIEDFHFYEYYQDDIIFASIVRKSYMNELLQDLSKEDLMIVHVSIGPFVLANLLSMIQGERSVYLCDYIVDVNDEKIVSFSNDGVALETQEINGEQLNYKEIPLMASLLNYKFPIEAIHFNSDMVASNREDYKYKKFFKTSGISALVFIMMALIIGHLFLEHFTNALAEKSAEYGMYQQSVEKIKLLKQEKEFKEKILFTSGINNENFLTKYMSVIGNTVPDDIQLISIDVMSPENKIRSEKKVTLTLNTIDIVGTTFNDNSFNDWMDKLRDVDWVKEINIVYQEDNKVNNLFTVKVKI